MYYAFIYVVYNEKIYIILHSQSTRQIVWYIYIYIYIYLPLIQNTNEVLYAWVLRKMALINIRLYTGEGGLWIDLKNPKIFTNTKNANICRFFSSSIYTNISFLFNKNEFSQWMFKRKTNETEKDQRKAKNIFLFVYNFDWSFSITALIFFDLIGLGFDGYNFKTHAKKCFFLLFINNYRITKLF